ncbi:MULTISPECIES: ribokinase [Bifidobacterium]|jgi:ribokinase|uniref:Ribokinase n=1 Tax=Bifidobacterium tibiigranuli TaxID=2172043 RepID=A0A5N6RZJ9_9BIFI|nr:ribokinase [Bifidobacterium tibiigranuli]KAE8127277.1 ribokinase [Bifidobacterium tibiigranuli]KAE8129668.1 ribokinase [Bifidobacterium tibiigranuli]
MDENVNAHAAAFASEGAHAVSAANEIAHVAAATARAADTAQSAAPARGRDEAFRLLNVIAQTHAGVSVIGSMNADYTVVAQRLPKPGETINGGPLRLLPGGKSANQAAAAARIGADARMFGAVGQDDNADFLLGCLKDAGVDVSHVDAVPGPSGTTVITVDAHGENTIVYSAGSNASVTTEYVRESRDAITGSSVLGLCLESPMETVTMCARICHDAGMLVLLNDSPFTAQLPAELIAASDILLVNEHEMSQLLGISEPADGDWSLVDWRDLAAAMTRYGFNRAIVTLGADGSVVLDQCSVHRIQPVRVDAIDTTGCGDAFMGTVLAGLASGLSLAQSAQCASYVSAYAATGAGAQNSYGTTAQIKQYFGGGAAM